MAFRRLPACAYLLLLFVLGCGSESAPKDTSVGASSSGSGSSNGGAGGNGVISVGAAGKASIAGESSSGGVPVAENGGTANVALKLQK